MSGINSISMKDIAKVMPFCIGDIEEEDGDLYIHLPFGDTDTVEELLERMRDITGQKKTSNSKKGNKWWIK